MGKVATSVPPDPLRVGRSQVGCGSGMDGKLPIIFSLTPRRKNAHAKEDEGGWVTGHARPSLIPALPLARPPTVFEGGVWRVDEATGLGPTQDLVLAAGFLISCSFLSSLLISLY